MLKNVLRAFYILILPSKYYVLPLGSTVFRARVQFFTHSHEETQKSTVVKALQKFVGFCGGSSFLPSIFKCYLQKLARNFIITSHASAGKMWRKILARLQTSQVRLFLLFSNIFAPFFNPMICRPNERSLKQGVDRSCINDRELKPYFVYLMLYNPVVNHTPYCWPGQRQA